VLLKFIRRLLWFLANRLMILLLLLAVITVVFYLSFNTTNIYILVKDGLYQRANVILRAQDDTNEVNALRNFFRQEFLDGDDALRIGLSEQSPYRDYRIVTFDHNVSLDSIRSLPWETRAEVVVTERIPRMEGRVIADRASLVADGTLTEYPPTWRGGQYRITLIRQAGRWRISRMEQLRAIIEPTPSPKPTAETTATPAPN